MWLYANVYNATNDKLFENKVYSLFFQRISELYLAGFPPEIFPIVLPQSDSQRMDSVELKCFRQLL